MHCCIRFEGSFNIKFVFLEHEAYFSGVFGVENFVKVSSSFVLLFVELVKVRSSNCENVLSLELSKDSLVESLDFLLRGELCGVLDSVGKKIIDFLE